MWTVCSHHNTHTQMTYSDKTGNATTTLNPLNQPTIGPRNCSTSQDPSQVVSPAPQVPGDHSSRSTSTPLLIIHRPFSAPAPLVPGMAGLPVPGHPGIPVASKARRPQPPCTWPWPAYSSCTKNYATDAATCCCILKHIS